MANTAPALTSENLRVHQPQYVKWLRRASARRRPLLEDRLAQAWEVARQSATLLRERYHARRVRVFGSLLHPDHFHAGSDIDLAVEGLTVHNYWDALVDILFFDEKIRVDLVDPDTCPSPIWKIVEQEGVDL